MKLGTDVVMWQLVASGAECLTEATQHLRLANEQGMLGHHATVAVALRDYSRCMEDAATIARTMSVLAGRTAAAARAS